MDFSPTSSSHCGSSSCFQRLQVQFVKGAAFLQKSNSREPTSSSIVGILQAMADDFAEDLQKELEEEKTNQNLGWILMDFD